MADDPTLDEVKAVLKRIQQLDFQASAIEETPKPSQNIKVPPRQALRVFDAKYAATVPAVTQTPEKTRRIRWPIYVGSAAAIVAVAVLGATFLIPLIVHKDALKDVESASLNRPSGDKNPQAGPSDKTGDAITSATQAAAIGQARTLLSNGDVTAARDLLLKAAADTPSGAFALAQAYDRNYLSTVSKPNADGDRAAAEFWYRRWYDLAIASGLKMDPERLSRIINAMK